MARGSAAYRPRPRDDRVGRGVPLSASRVPRRRPRRGHRGWRPRGRSWVTDPAWGRRPTTSRPRRAGRSGWLSPATRSWASWAAAAWASSTRPGRSGSTARVALKMILAGDHAEPEAACPVPAPRPRPSPGSSTRNIVQIYDIGEHDGLPFFELEYVDGGSLDRQLDGTPWPPRRAARLVETAGPGHRRGAPAGDRPPRPQAGQHAADRRRHAQDHRLRPGQDDWAATRA